MNSFLLKILYMFPAEISHNIALFFLRYPFLFKKFIINNSLLETKIFSKTLSHPLGIAAGFDKNATALPGLIKLGFSFIEIGTVTPNPQRGNSRPRVFRLKKNKAIINRLGFPNKGSKIIAKNLIKVRKYHRVGTEPLIGVNIGLNKDTQNPYDDYKHCLEKLSYLADYITVNISSPNTIGLRTFQKSKKLIILLQTVNLKRKELEKKISRKIPLVLKISPDLKKSELWEIVKASRKNNFEAIEISNTSLDNNILFSEKNSTENGGISGLPLFKQSTNSQFELFKMTRGSPKIIGIGGINSSKSALEKIQKGANAIQLYTALVYHGHEIVKIILENMKQDIRDKKLKSIRHILKKL